MDVGLKSAVQRSGNAAASRRADKDAKSAGSNREHRPPAAAPIEDRFKEHCARLDFSQAMRAPRITDDVTVTRSSRPAETTVGTEVVLMTLDSGQCFGLGETGSAVWRLLAHPTRLQPIVDALSSTYDAPAPIIERDVRELLEEMLDRGLIELQ